MKRFKCRRCKQYSHKETIDPKGRWNGRICDACESELQHFGTKTYGKHPEADIINPKACEKARELLREAERRESYINNLPKAEDVFKPLFNDIFIWDNGKMNNFCDMQNKLLTMV